MSNTHFLLAVELGSVGTRGGCYERREQSFVGCTHTELPPKGDPVLGFGGCLGTSLRGLSKPERAVCFCQDRQSCSVLCQEAELSAHNGWVSLHLSLEQLSLALEETDQPDQG